MLFINAPSVTATDPGLWEVRESVDLPLRDLCVDDEGNTNLRQDFDALRHR